MKFSSGSFIASSVLLLISTSIRAEIGLNPLDDDYSAKRLEFNKCQQVTEIASGKRLDELLAAYANSSKVFFWDLSLKVLEARVTLERQESKLLTKNEIDELAFLDYPRSFEVGAERGFYMTIPVKKLGDRIASCIKFLKTNNLIK